MFGDGMSVITVYSFLGYKPRNGGAGIVEGSIMHSAHLDAWIATVQTCLKQRKEYGRHRRKVYVDNFTSQMSGTETTLIDKFSDSYRFEIMKNWN